MAKTKEKIVKAFLLGMAIGVLFVFMVDAWRLELKSKLRLNLMFQRTNPFQKDSDLFQEGDLLQKNSEPVTLLMTGDVNLGRAVNYQIKVRNDFHYPFLETADFLQEADLTVINLESVLFKGCPLTNEGMKLCGSPENIAGLVFAGVDIASLANNHQNDFGQLALEETKVLLSQYGLSSLDNEEVAIRKVKGTRFAFLASNLVDRQPDLTVLEKKIKFAESQAEIVVAIFHWGIEYTRQPSSKQREMAHWVIDKGADLVLGNHPHWVQTTETYQDKLIVYSHGNFIFDQPWSEETKKGVIGLYTFKDGGLVDFELLPVLIDNLFQPKIVEGSSRAAENFDQVIE